ncbi:MAG: SWIM zinc finger family protein, partial [Acetatifactor sp.]|nr:SWIM zinc finger family protein [Acetatifactor sp.]
MIDWRQSLAGVDEDYLVGISNKGIVKRAYKDLEAEGGNAQDAAAVLDWQAQELTVAAGGENVTIRLPLGESRCSCPSRSICRHVIMAILLARQAAAGAGPKQPGDSGGPTVENPVGDDSPAAENLESSGDLSDLPQKVWQEILSQPRKPLLRALGIRGLRRLAAAMEAGQIPQVERGTVVRMQLPGQDMTVKLLSPLEYSTCTCHKKELCSHKAEAILWCQYMEKQLTAKELAQELEQQPDLDLEELSDTAEQVGSCLEHLLETGLARSGAQQAQELERLAILCHNAG